MSQSLCIADSNSAPTTKPNVVATCWMPNNVPALRVWMPDEKKVR